MLKANLSPEIVVLKSPARNELPPSVRKVDASPSRPFQLPERLIKAIDASLQRSRLG